MKDRIRQSASVKNQCLADTLSLYSVLEVLLLEAKVYLCKSHRSMLKIQHLTGKIKFFFVLLPESWSLVTHFRIFFFNPSSFFFPLFSPTTWPPSLVESQPQPESNLSKFPMSELLVIF